MMASFDFNYQNPSLSLLLMLIRVIIVRCHLLILLYRKGSEITQPHPDYKNKKAINCVQFEMYKVLT